MFKIRKKNLFISQLPLFPQRLLNLKKGATNDDILEVFK